MEPSGGNFPGGNLPVTGLSYRVKEVMFTIHKCYPFAPEFVRFCLFESLLVSICLRVCLFPVV